MEFSQCVVFAYLYLHIITAVQGLTSFPEPDYVSSWATVESQSDSISEVTFNHGFGEVPIFVDIQVKSTDSPNENFTFPAIGSNQRDDDATDMHGGVVYVYNDTSIWVLVPNKANKYEGIVIYTGEPPYWRGINTQSSTQAEVRARAWLTASFPAPDFHVTGLRLKAGDDADSETYIETAHGLGTTPTFVRARTHLHGHGAWVSDAQGANLFARKPSSSWIEQSTTIYGYNKHSVRVWAAALNEAMLFSNDDGWGRRDDYFKYDEGTVETMAWRTFGIPILETSFPIGPGIPNETLEIQLPYIQTDNYVLTVMVEATDGANMGYRFPGAGSAMTNDDVATADMPCNYGGLVYAYSATSLRLWWPMDPSGGVVCIANYMGNGTNTQASQTAIAVITVWTTENLTLGIVPSSVRSPGTCLRFIQSATGVRVSLLHAALEEKTSSWTITECIELCKDSGKCNAFSFGPKHCAIYNMTETFSMIPSPGISVWQLE